MVKKALSVIVGVGIMVASPLMYHRIGASISPQNLPRRLRGSRGEAVAINDMKEEKAHIKTARAVDQILSNTEVTKPVTRLVVRVGAAVGNQAGDPEDSILPFCLWVCIVLAFAFFYKQKVVDAIPVLSPVAPSGAPDFKNSMFDCFGDMNTCLFGWCCVVVRTAHTTQATGVMDFWMAIGAQIVSMLLAACCVPMCLFTYLRMEVKTKLGIKPNAAMDCVSTFCCLPCATCQAAREVDENCGVSVSCPFTVTHGAHPQPQTMQGRQMG